MITARRSGVSLLKVFFLLLLGLSTTTARGADPVGNTRLLSVGLSGEAALCGAAAGLPTISRDGRYVAFLSDALDYAPVQAGLLNVFVKDLVTGDVELVSQSTGGVPANGSCYSAHFSGNGRYVVFGSAGTNLIDGVERQDGPYLRDRVTRTTERIPPPEEGGTAGSVQISADGRYLLHVYQSRISLRDRVTGSLELISVRPDNTPFYRVSDSLAMTPDARFIAFTAPHNSEQNAPDDLWLRDRIAGTTELISAPAPGASSVDAREPSLSDDGRFVLYRFWNGVDIIPAVRDRQTGELQVYPQLDGSAAKLSADGTTILHESFVDGATHFWLVSRPTGALRELTLSPGGQPAHAGPYPARLYDVVPRWGISATPDLGTVVFATSLVDLLDGDTNGRSDVFAWSSSGAPLRRVSIRPDGGETGSPPEFHNPVQSPDGRFVAFVTDARDLAPGDVGGLLDVYVLDRNTGLFDCASRSTAGVSANYHTGRNEDAPAITPDGRYVVFSSFASNLVEGDTNERADAFLHDRQIGTTTRVSLDGQGNETPTGIYAPPAISGNGRYVTLSSCDPLDGRPVLQHAIFIRDRWQGRIERATVSTSGQPLQGYFGAPTLSVDGRFVCFTYAPLEGMPGGRIRRVLVRDRLRRTTEEVPGSRKSYRGLSASSDSRYVAYPSDHGWKGNRHSVYQNAIVVTDRLLGTTQRTSVQDGGDDFPYGTWDGSLSPDGGFLAFTTKLPSSTSSRDAVFLRDRRARRTYLVSRALDGTAATSYYFDRPVSVSSGGRHVVFTVDGAQLVEGGPTAGKHLYAFDRD